MLDAMVASALKILLNTQSNFQKKSKCRRTTSSEDKIAYMSYEYFRATGVYETAQGPADFVSMILQNDDVQDFDVKWDQALFGIKHYYQ